MEQISQAIWQGATVIIIAIIGYASTALVAFIKEKTENYKTDRTAKYIDEFNGLVFDVVSYIQADYVKELKTQNKFNKAEQLEALKRAKNRIIALASNRMKEAVINVHKDINEYITTKIENAVTSLK